MLQKIMNWLNNLRPRQLLVLAVGAALMMFLAIVAGMSFMTNKEVVVMPSEPPPKEEPVIQTKSVVVAKVNIPARTRIQDSMLQIKEIPADIVPNDAILNFDAVKNAQVKASIFAGDILTIQKVFNAVGDEGFAGQIPADCRAVSINVNEITSVAGFAKPGDKVDLLLVEKSNYSATTSVLLQNVPLLSINQDAVGSSMVDPNGMAPSAISNPTIATFALPPEDVLKLISASRLGEIYMMLRPASPRANYFAEMEYTIDSINKPKPEPPAPVIPSTPPPNLPLPQIPAVPLEPTVPKFDIILGDEIVQSAEEDKKKNPSVQSNSALPAIPSGGASSGFSAPPVPNTPLANTPIMNQISGNL